MTGPSWAFDVATVPANLPMSGHRDITRPRWTRVVVYVEAVWRSPITRALLARFRQPCIRPAQLQA